MPTRWPRKAGEFVLVQIAEILAIDGDLAGCRPFDPAGNRHQRGFSRARWTDDTDRLTRRHIEIDTAQDLDRPSRTGQGQVDILDGNHQWWIFRFGHHGS